MESKGTGPYTAGQGRRFGITLGGTAFVSAAAEYQFDGRGIELSVGTFSWRDLSLSAVGKQYVGGSDVRGFVGAGFWTSVAFPAEGRTGYALLLRVPVGVEARAGERHAAGLELGLNRALAVRRTDPEDLRPPRARVVPLPGILYRYGARR